MLSFLKKLFWQIWDIWSIAAERHLSMFAAGVAFYGMLALFPALAAVIALVGFWADPTVVRDTLDMAEEFVPDEAFAIISDQTTRLVQTTSRTLGWASIISLLAAAWSARLGVDALAQGLNAIYGGVQRGGLWNIAVALILTAVLMAVGVVAVAAILFTPLVLSLAAPFLPEGSWLPLVADLMRWGVAGSALIVGLGFFYRYGPHRPETDRTPFLSYGLLLAMLLWGGASVGFSVFLSNFGRYNEIYGSIGAVIALLMWFYIAAYAVLLGGALNYLIERTRLNRSTEAAAELDQNTIQNTNQSVIRNEALIQELEPAR